MILPKDFMEKIEYFEHSIRPGRGCDMYDVFVIHFKSWWRRARKIEIKRLYAGKNANGTFSHESSPSAADLYNQLNGYAIQTHKEKLDSVTKKYNKDETGKVLYLKPKPKLDGKEKD